jgi:ABC-type multidrug transport system fused ATPase/permease subunit
MFRDIRKVWFLFSEAEKRSALKTLGLVVSMAIAETASVLSIMPFLSVLSRPEIVRENRMLSITYERFGFDSTQNFIVALGLASILVVMASSSFKLLTFHAINRFVHIQRHSISSRLLSRYLHQPYEFFLGRNTSTLSKGVLSEVDQLVFDLVQPLSQLLAQSAVALSILLVVILLDPTTALAIITVLCVLYGAIYAFARNKLGRIGHERQLANSRRYRSCHEALTGIKDVKVTRSAQAYQLEFERASYTYSRHSATSETLSQSPLYVVEAVGYSMLIIVALVLYMRSGGLEDALPRIGLYGFAAYRMLPAAQIIYRGLARMRFSTAPLNSVYTDLMLPVEREPKDLPILEPKVEIRLSNVSYAYPTTPDRLVISGLNLTVPANTSLGIGGKSGAGKTTVMDLLLGLLSPQSGTLSIDGVAIDSRNVAAWQRGIGYVPQHIFLADNTVAENIAFGVPRNAIDMAAVESAARLAQIHAFVSGDLDRGYETIVGDRGIRLSGGQRQRIGIARALYRNPAVLLFDEATSALDEETEAAFNEAIRSLSGKKTIIVISHKATSLRYCDRRLMLGDSVARA